MDFGGTKIEAAALDADGCFLSRIRQPNPGSYDAAIGCVADLVARVEAEAGGAGMLGVGAPGSVSPRTGLMRNANSTYLNGRPFRQDLERALGRRVRLANDANCLALSEASDGAAAGMRVACAIILGTGCGGGVVVGGRIVEGATGIAGEIGHIPLPWPSDAEHPGPQCWCGQRSCLECWISGTGFSRDHLDRTGECRDGSAIVSAARSGDPGAEATLHAYVDRLGRAVALIANLLDPDCFVLGGGMSNVAEIYDRLPAVVRRYTFSDGWDVPVVQAKWGDSSGVRGAARLWP